MSESERTHSWPQPLEAIAGPFPERKLAGVLGGMGSHAPRSRALLERGRLTPDMLTQPTLYPLQRRTRKKRFPAT